MRPRLLELYCGAGGTGKGYDLAGFDVTGVDINPQPRYPFKFYQANALTFPLDGYDVIHASCPCQRWSDLQRLSRRIYPDLIAPTRERLIETGVPYIMENVPEAPLINPVILCGTMFPGLRVIRHRAFECSFPVRAPSHHTPHPLVFTHDKRKAHYGKLDQSQSFVQVTGGGNCTVDNARDAMGIDWMTKAELNEAIPPAYTAYIGHWALGFLAHRRLVSATT